MIVKEPMDSKPLKTEKVVLSMRKIWSVQKAIALTQRPPASPRHREIIGCRIECWIKSEIRCWIKRWIGCWIGWNGINTASLPLFSLRDRIDLDFSIPPSDLLWNNIIDTNGKDVDKNNSSQKVLTYMEVVKVGQCNYIIQSLSHWPTLMLR